MSSLTNKKRQPQNAISELHTISVLTMVGLKLIGQRFFTYQSRFKSEGRRTGIFCAIDGQ